MPGQIELAKRHRAVRIPRPDITNIFMPCRAPRQYADRYNYPVSIRRCTFRSGLIDGDVWRSAEFTGPRGSMVVDYGSADHPVPSGRPSARDSGRRRLRAQEGGSS